MGTLPLSHACDTAPPPPPPPRDVTAMDKGKRNELTRGQQAAFLALLSWGPGGARCTSFPCRQW